MANNGLDLEKLKLQTRRAIGGRPPIQDESVKPTNESYVIPDPEDPKGADDTMLWLQQELDNMDDVSHTVSGVNSLVRGFNNKPVDQSTAEFEGAPEATFEEFDNMDAEEGDEEFASDEVMRSIEEVEGMLDSTPTENGRYIQEEDEEPLDDTDSIEKELNKSDKPAKGIPTPDTIEDIEKVTSNLEADLLGEPGTTQPAKNTAMPKSQTGFLPTEDEAEFDIPQEAVKAYEKVAERLLGGKTAGKKENKKGKEPKEGEEESEVDFFTRMSDRLSDDNYTGDKDLRSGEGTLSNWGKSFAPTEEEHSQAMDRMSAILGSMYNSPGLRPTINIGGGSKTVMQQAPQGPGAGAGTNVNIPIDEEEAAEEYIAENPPPTTDDDGSWWPWLAGAAGLVGAGLLAALYRKGTGKTLPPKIISQIEKQNAEVPGLASRMAKALGGEEDTPPVPRLNPSEGFGLEVGVPMYGYQRHDITPKEEAAQRNMLRAITPAGAKSSDDRTRDLIKIKEMAGSNRNLFDALVTPGQRDEAIMKAKANYAATLYAQGVTDSDVIAKRINNMPSDFWRGTVPAVKKQSASKGPTSTKAAKDNLPKIKEMASSNRNLYDALVTPGQRDDATMRAKADYAATLYAHGITDADAIAKRINSITHDSWKGVGAGMVAKAAPTEGAVAKAAPTGGGVAVVPKVATKEDISRITNELKNNEFLNSNLGLGKSASKRTAEEKALFNAAQVAMVEGKSINTTTKLIKEMKRRLPDEIDAFKKAKKVDELSDIQLGKVVSDLRRKMETGQ